jgi:hypothetical protein
MKIVITLESIEELRSLLSLKTRNKVSDAELSSIFETSKEDGEAVAHFAEELSKIIDARKKKD